MKYPSLLILLACLAACNDKEVDPAQRPLIGTYKVNHLTQYQNGRIIFDGDLPAVLGDSVIIEHGLSIDLSTLKSSANDAFISYHMERTWSNVDSTTNYSSTYGRPIADNQITIKPAQSLGTFSFFKNNTTLIGNSDGNTLSFDFIEPDSLGHDVRYVYEAKKTSDIPNKY
jgi:hypothetical protein